MSILGPTIATTVAAVGRPLRPLHTSQPSHPPPCPTTALCCSISCANSFSDTVRSPDRPLYLFCRRLAHRSISPPHRSTSSPRSNRLPSHRSMRRSSDTWIFVDCAVTIAKDPSTRNTSVDVFFVSCVNTTEEQPSVSNVSTAAFARTSA